MEETQNKVLKRKKLNIFQRLSNRISKYFHTSKPSNVIINEDGVTLARSCLEDKSDKSKSHEDLRVKNKFRRNKKTCGKFLNSLSCPLYKQRKKSQKCIPKQKDRCLSEGDLSREDGHFGSQESSPIIGDSNTNHSITRPDNMPSSNNTRIHYSFKNELALKLRAKNLSRDNDSQHSKTPDSPTHNSSTPLRHHQFIEARTPQSMSSLSHSSNSLLSGNIANNYPTSDGDSMSRSVIDSNDDSGIVVDLATPMCKTTNGALLDFSAARQKIAASKSRRVRPKALAKDSGDVILQNDSERFSPVREKRDILEEISEEDCSLSPSVLTINKPQKVDPSSKIDHSTKSIDLNQDSVPLTKKLVSIKLDPNINNDPSLKDTRELGHLPKGDINTGNDSVKATFGLLKSKFQFDNVPRGDSYKSESTPKFYTKLRPTGSINLPPSSDKTSDGKIGRVVMSEDCMKSPAVKEGDYESGPPKINRYSSLRTNTDTKIIMKPQCAQKNNVANQESEITSNIATDYDNKRASRVLTMVKNFEFVPSRDSN